MADGRTLTDRARAALIREWGREQGWELSGKGKLPAGVISAYEAAHTNGSGDPDGGDEPGPDWDAAAVALSAGDPLAGLESEAVAGEADGPPNEESGGLPPPSSLEEARARFDRKPKRPAWAGGDSKPKDGRAAPKVSRAVVGDIEGKLTLLLSGPAVFWQMADPLCGGAFAENLDNIVRKAVPLICQSPDAVRWFTKGATFLLWLDLVWALQPVAQSVYAHHVAATVMVLPDGRVVAARRLEDGRVVPADSVPPPAGPDVSAYTTRGHIPTPRPA